MAFSRSYFIASPPSRTTIFPSPISTPYPRPTFLRITSNRSLNRVVLSAATTAGTDAGLSVCAGDDLPENYGSMFPSRDPARRRRVGVLLHPSSLPGPYGIGDFGKEAFRFLDWLHSAGCSLWQASYFFPFLISILHPSFCLFFMYMFKSH